MLTIFILTQIRMNFNVMLLKCNSYFLDNCPKTTESFPPLQL